MQLGITLAINMINPVGSGSGSSSPSLDFSVSTNSMYIAAIF